MYVQSIDEKELRRFLDFLAETILVQTTLDQCWAIGMHMEDEGRSPVGDLVYRAKSYSGKPGDRAAAEELAGLIVERVVKHPQIRGADIVVGVPANPPKVPYNLSKLIAERIGQRLGLSVSSSFLEKIRPTVEIKNIPNEEKLEVLQGAYEVRERLNDEAVVLVDDLIRSGSTIGYCATQFREKGAGCIFGVVATKTIRGET